MERNCVGNAFRNCLFGNRVENETALQYVPVQNNEPQIFVYLSSDETKLPLPYKPEQTVKEVCEEIARKINIPPEALPFFTLLSKSGGHYLNQESTLSESTECKQQYEFRLAFKACRASRLKAMGDWEAVEYLFQQSRKEFLQCSTEITFSEREDKKHFVKLVILELIYISKQIKVEPEKLLDHPKHYKIKGLLRRDIFRHYKISELKKYVIKHLCSAEGMRLKQYSDERLILEYLHVVEQSDNFFVHAFTVYKHFEVNNKSIGVKYELIISPQDGIRKRELDRPNQIPEEILRDFSEVCDLEIKQIGNHHVIIISRFESNSEILIAMSLRDAQSIVAVINGYYQLLVNRYRNLNATALHYIPKVHGPISRDRSVAILQSQGYEDGIYLVRQSRKVFGEYVLSLMHNQQINHYKINKVEDGLLALKQDDTDKDATIEGQRFESIDAFIRFYKESKCKLPVCLKKICLPSSKGTDAHLMPFCPLVPITPRPKDLDKFGLKSIKALDINLLRTVGESEEFGEVILAEWKAKEGINPTNIVIRKLKKRYYDKSFFDVGKGLLELRNINIICHYGVTQLKQCLGLVIEYAKDNLESYIQYAVSKPQGLSKKHVILFAAQIAEGMMYLKNMKCIHGHLRARNILVANDEQIKIGDIGLLDLKRHGGEFITHGKKLVSAGYCWHPPEMLADPKISPSHESDVWSLGVTMWEMFALKKPFHCYSGTSIKPLSRQEIHNLYVRQQYLNTRGRNNLPEAVANVVQECWNPCKKERISFLNIITALRNLVMGATPEQYKVYLTPLTLDQEIEDWEKPNNLTDTTQFPNQSCKLITDKGHSMMIDSSTGQYSQQDGTVTPAQSDNGNTGQYSQQGGKVKTTQSDNCNTGHYSQQDGTVKTTQSDNGNIGHYSQQDGTVTPPQSDNGNTGHYSQQDGTVTPPQSDNGNAGQYSQQNGTGTPPQSDNGNTGHYSQQDGTVTPTQSDNGNAGQYSQQDGTGTPPQSDNGNTGHYSRQDGTVTPPLSDNGNAGQYSRQDGTRTPPLSENGNTGQYSQQDGTVTPPLSDNGNTRHYSQQDGTVTPPLSDNGNTGHYSQQDGTVTPPLSDNGNTGHYSQQDGTGTPHLCDNGNTGHYSQQDGTVTPPQSDNGNTGHYSQQDGTVTPPLSDNGNTGHYSQQDGTVTPPLCDNGNTGHYSQQDGTVTPPLCDNGNTGHYSQQDGTVTPPQSDNVNTGHYSQQDGTGTPPLCDNGNTGHYSQQDGTVTPPKFDNDGGCRDAAKVETVITSTSTGKAFDLKKKFIKRACSVMENRFEDCNRCNLKGEEDSNEHEVEHKVEENVMKDKLKDLSKKVHKSFLVNNLRITKKEIGRGNFGVVRMGYLNIVTKNFTQKKIVAVKELKMNPNEKVQDDFINEAINLQELRNIKNNNIITPIGICLDVDKEKLQIVTELAPLGDLRNYLQTKKSRIGIPKLLEFSLQIANAMVALENFNILHRDLALRNVLVVAEDHVKISDFGMSRFSDYYKASDGEWPLRWYAPESLGKNKFITKSDVWSFGITLWEMFSYGGEKPYPKVENLKILDYILSGGRPLQPKNCPFGVFKIMQQCWKKDIIERPTFFFLHAYLIPNEMKKCPKEESINFDNSLSIDTFMNESKT